MLFYRIEIKPEISLHPWLSGLLTDTVSLGYSWTIILRLLLIAASTFLARLLAIHHFDIPTRDYMLVSVLPVLHFTINDWNVGLLAALYWTVFLLTLYLLFPNTTNRSENRNTLTAAFFCGLLLLNGAFAVVFFIAGITVMVSMHSFSFRNLMIWLTGFLAPGFFVFSYYLLLDKTSIITSDPNSFILSEQLFQFDFPVTYYAGIAILFILAILVHSRMGEFKISVRRSYTALILSLTLLLPGIMSSAINTRMMFSIFGLATSFYWIKAMYISRRRIPFFVLLVLPVLLPVLYYFVLKY